MAPENSNDSTQPRQAKTSSDGIAASVLMQEPGTQPKTSTDWFAQ